MQALTEYSYNTFESIKKYTDDGREYWYARDLQGVLDYAKWSTFTNVINKAKQSCENSGANVLDHFADVGKTIDMPKGATRIIDDLMLSRYACYLIVQNGDPRKEIIAQGQSYFAVKTREREIQEQFDKLTEEEKRLAIRNELKNHNRSLAEAARNAGVESHIDYAIFQNSGYQGLYGGLDAKGIHAKKNLKKSQKILDHMGSTELAANLFRATQTDEKLRREEIKGKEKANEAHYEVGKKVRQTIKELGGTMPEDLETPKKSVKSIEQEQQKKFKK